MNLNCGLKCVYIFLFDVELVKIYFFLCMYNFYVSGSEVCICKKINV